MRCGLILNINEIRGGGISARAIIAGLAKATKDFDVDSFWSPTRCVTHA